MKKYIFPKKRDKMKKFFTVITWQACRKIGTFFVGGAIFLAGTVPGRLCAQVPSQMESFCLDLHLEK
jgi:hypothetical protein